METLYALEKVRTPFFDAVFSVLTYLGSEAVVLVLLLVMMWCFDKKFGRFVMYASLFSLGLNVLLKNIFCVPRPWTIDPDFTIVENARAAATGYSFPSGHTANAVTVYGSILAYRKNSLPWIFGSVAVIGTVAFSRLYLGVHTLQDVLVSLALGAVILTAMYFVGKTLFTNVKTRMVLDGAVILFSLGILVYMLVRNPVEGADAVLAAEGLKNAFSSAGAAVALILALYIDDTRTKYETKAVWWAQIIKVLLGGILVFTVKELLKVPLNVLFAGSNLAHAVRYFLMVFVGGCLWPMTFGFWSSLGKIKNKETNQAVL